MIGFFVQFGGIGPCSGQGVGVGELPLLVVIWLPIELVILSPNGLWVVGFIEDDVHVELSVPGPHPDVDDRVKMHPSPG